MIQIAFSIINIVSLKKQTKDFYLYDLSYYFYKILFYYHFHTFCHLVRALRNSGDNTIRSLSNY